MEDSENFGAVIAAVLVGIAYHGLFWLNCGSSFLGGGVGGKGGMEVEMNVMTEQTRDVDLEKFYPDPILDHRNERTDKVGQ